MRLGLVVLFVALLLAVVAGQNSLLKSTEAEGSASAITACAVQGSCTQSPLDSSPGSIAPEHIVYIEGCYSSDLHVVRYVPDDSETGEPVVAKWCG